MKDNDEIKYARDVVARDPMASFLGIKLEEIRPSYARLSLLIRPEYLNAVNRAHGMAISCIIDQAVAVASNATGYQSLVVELKINFLAAVSPEDTIFAEARPIDIKRKLSLWEVNVVDSTRTRVATAQALVYQQPRNPSQS